MTDVQKILKKFGATPEYQTWSYGPNMGAEIRVLCPELGVGHGEWVSTEYLMCGVSVRRCPVDLLGRLAAKAAARDGEQVSWDAVIAALALAANVPQLLEFLALPVCVLKGVDKRYSIHPSHTLAHNARVAYHPEEKHHHKDYIRLCEDTIKEHWPNFKIDTCGWDVPDEYGEWANTRDRRFYMNHFLQQKS